MTRRLLPSLTVALLLALAPSAAAAEWNVEVDVFAFAPKESKIAPGDTVNWNFQESGHTTVSSPGQVERWDSQPSRFGTNAVSTTYSRTFDTPGRFQYVCDPHDFMKGTIEVGRDTVRDTVDGFKTVRRGNDVTVKFKLNEAAKVTYKLGGEARRSYTRARLRAGRRSISFRNLPAGDYRGTLTLVDDFDNRTKPRNSFEIG